MSSRTGDISVDEHHGEGNRPSDGAIRSAETETNTDKPKMKDNVDILRSKLHVRSDFIRCVMAEFFCTAMLLFGGTATTAQYVLSKQENNAYIGVTLGWGFSLVFAVYGGFLISGSHLNPAVSLFLFTMRRLSALRLVAYSIAQVLGAFVGAFLTYITYYDALNAFDGGIRHVSGPNATAGIFATYPQEYLSVVGGIIDQVVGTAFLCICVSLLTDKNNKIPTHLQPLLIGLVVVLAGMTVGMNSGYAINPARDLGPRIFTLCAGYGIEVFSYRNYTWFWIPVVCPMIGAVVGAWLYQLFLGIQMNETKDALPIVVRTNTSESMITDAWNQGGNAIKFNVNGKVSPSS